MKNLNRWVYAIIGVITLLLAGLVYAWSVMSKSIGASRPDWTAAQLSMTFTMVMAFFCIGCLIAGMMAKKVSPKIYIILSGILFLAGFDTPLDIFLNLEKDNSIKNAILSDLNDIKKVYVI